MIEFIAPENYTSSLFDGLFIQNGAVTNHSTMPIPIYPFIRLNSRFPTKKIIGGTRVSTNPRKDPIFSSIFMGLSFNYTLISRLKTSIIPKLDFFNVYIILDKAI